jgi:branched-chain amino acid transport system substrate-binding protein
MSLKSLMKLIVTVAIGLSSASIASAGNIRVGVILGFTGPIESLTPTMADSAELAFKEASDSRLLLGGDYIVPMRADSTCIDADAATAAAERLITSDEVAAIFGADCSGVTTAIANSVAVPNGVSMISPSATSPALTTINDNGLFFRTAPSDARGGQILAAIAKDRGVTNVAITYTNNDYGKGLADVFAASFEALGGTVSMVAAHEDGKGDYSAEVGALSASGAEDLVVIGYLDQGGRGMIQSSFDSGAFDRFVLSDGMIGQSLIDNVQGDLSKSFGSMPGSESDGAKIFNEIATAAGIDGQGPYAPESYDAGALIALAIQAGGSADRASIAANIQKVANAPGTKILPGQIAKGLKILADGGIINYEGASNVEFTEVGEASGSFKELEISGGKFVTAAVR